MSLQAFECSLNCIGTIVGCALHSVALSDAHHPPASARLGAQAATNLARFSKWAADLGVPASCATIAPDDFLRSAPRSIEAKLVQLLMQVGQRQRAFQPPLSAETGRRLDARRMSPPTPAEVTRNITLARAALSRAGRPSDDVRHVGEWRFLVGSGMEMTLFELHGVLLARVNGEWKSLPAILNAATTTAATTGAAITTAAAVNGKSTTRATVGATQDRPTRPPSVGVEPTTRAWAPTVAPIALVQVDSRALPADAFVAHQEATRKAAVSERHAAIHAGSVVELKAQLSDLEAKLNEKDERLAAEVREKERMRIELASEAERRAALELEMKQKLDEAETQFYGVHHGQYDDMHGRLQSVHRQGRSIQARVEENFRAQIQVRLPWASYTLVCSSIYQWCPCPHFVAHAATFLGSVLA
jgi:hypothetical protein